MKVLFADGQGWKEADFIFGGEDEKALGQAGVEDVLGGLVARGKADHQAQAVNFGNAGAGGKTGFQELPLGLYLLQEGGVGNAVQHDLGAGAGNGVTAEGGAVAAGAEMGL